MRKKLIRSKTTKKALAAIMVASLCMNQLSVASYASVATDSNATEASAEAAAGTTTEITSETVTTPAGDVQVTVTTEVTITDSSDTNGNNVQTTVTTENWSTTPDSEENTDAETETEITVTGQETTTSTIVTEQDGDLVSTSYSENGSEQTDITTTTDTTVSVEEEVLISDETSDPTIIDDLTSITESSTETTGEWIEGTPEENGDWEQTGSTEGEWTDIDVTNENSAADGTEEIELADPLDTTDVTLDLTPGTSDTETKQLVTVEDLVAGNIEGISLDEDGNPVVTNPTSTTTDADGNIITTTYSIAKVENGYQITKNVTTTSTSTETGTESELEETGTIENTTSTATTPTLTEDLKDILTNGESGTNAAGQNVKTTTETTVNADGDLVTVTTEILEIIENGVVVGYEVTKTTTTEIQSSTGIEASGETTSTTNTTESFTLPEKPTASDTTNEATGERTVVTVEEVTDASGNVIGYKSTTVITDANGTELGKSTETIYGTSTKSSDTTEIDPTLEINTTTTTIVEKDVTTYSAETITQDVELTNNRTDVITTTEVTDTTTWQLVTTDDGTFFIYEGQMYEVVAEGDNGEVTMASLQPNLSLTPGTYNGATNDATDLRNPTNDSTGGTIKDGYDFIYTGYGLESAIQAITNKNNGSSTLTHQFKLVDKDGNAHYVLCADLGTTAIRNTNYSMENVETADYYKRDGAAEKIKAIALNGYWGTDSGVGSLAQCKELFRTWLAANGKDTSLADKLTHGEALTATQAAIWNYGNSKESNYMSSTQAAGYDYAGGLTTEEKNCTNYFYQALLAVNPDTVEDTTTTFITEQNFATESAIVIKEKAANVAANADDNPDNDVYKTDVSFTLEMNKSDVTGDLVVYVRDAAGNVLATRRISGNGDEARFGEGDIQEYENSTSYTIRDIQLSENVRITLNLEGTQNLAQGVYLYSAETYSTSQTFVGVASGSREVDLTVDLKFEVTEPTASLSTDTDSSGHKKVDTETYEKTYTRTDTRTDEETVTTTETSATEEKQTEVFATITVTNTTEETTRIEKTWEKKAEEIVNNDTTDDDEKDDDKEEEKDDDKDDEREDDRDDEYEYEDDNDEYEETTERTETNNDTQIVDIIDDSEVLGEIYIEESEVPMAIAPMTGETSGLWLFLSTISGFILAGFSFLENKKNKFKFDK